MNHKGLNRFNSTAPLTIYKTRAKSSTNDQDPGTTQPEGNSIHLNYKFIIFLTFKIFPVLVVNSLCKNIFLIFFSKFPVFSLSGKMDFQIPCFPCAVATRVVHSSRTGNRLNCLRFPEAVGILALLNVQDPFVYLRFCSQWAKKIRFNPRTSCNRIQCKLDPMYKTHFCGTGSLVQINVQYWWPGFPCRQFEFRVQVHYWKFVVYLCHCLKTKKYMYLKCSLISMLKTSVTRSLSVQLPVTFALIFQLTMV